MSILWLIPLAFLVLLTIYLLTTSVYMIDADKMLISIFFGSYKGVYVSGTYLENTPPRKRGCDYLPAHFFDFVALLWPLWQPVFIPSTPVKLRYHAGRIYTEDGIPVRLDVTIIFQLDACLSDFIETFNVIGKGYDLAREEDITYMVDRDMETGEITTRKYKQACLAQIILDDTTNLVHETLRRAAADLEWNNIRKEIHGFENEVKWYLAAPESLFARSGMLKRIPGVHHGVKTGKAVRVDGFDIQFEDIVPMDNTFFQSLSAPETGRRRGEEEGNRIKAIQEATHLSSEEVIRNETLRGVQEVNVIAAGDTLTAMVGGLITNRNSPRTGTQRGSSSTP